MGAVLGNRRQPDNSATADQPDSPDLTTTGTQASHSSGAFGDKIRTTLRCAKLSDLAYEEYHVVLEKLPEYGLQAEMEIHNKDTDTEGFIASDSSSIVVAFRGTKSFEDVITDLRFKAVPIGPGLPLAHDGFVKAIDAVYTSIEEKLKPHLSGKKQLFITGHSLGAALASLLSYRLSLDHPTCQPNVYVFGCPPTGDETFAKSFKGSLSNVITIDGDPVSTGDLISLGKDFDLHKPVEVKYLPGKGGHPIVGYIEQLEKLVELYTTL